MGNAATSQTLYIPRIRISIALIMAAVVLLSIASGDSTTFAQTPELAADNAFEFAFELEGGDPGDLRAGERGRNVIGGQGGRRGGCGRGQSAGDGAGPEFEEIAT